MKPWSDPAVDGVSAPAAPLAEVDPDEETLWEFESRLWRTDAALFGDRDGSYCEWLKQLMLRMRRGESNFDVRAPLLPRAARAGVAYAAVNLNAEPRELRLRHLTRQAFRRPMPELGTLEYRALCKRVGGRDQGVYVCTTTYILHRQDWFVIQHRRLSVR